MSGESNLSFEDLVANEKSFIIVTQRFLIIIIKKKKNFCFYYLLFSIIILTRYSVLLYLISIFYCHIKIMLFLNTYLHI